MGNTRKLGDDFSGKFLRRAEFLHHLFIITRVFKLRAVKFQGFFLLPDRKRAKLKFKFGKIFLTCHF